MYIACSPPCIARGPAHANVHCHCKWHTAMELMLKTLPENTLCLSLGNMLGTSFSNSESDHVLAACSEIVLVSTSWPPVRHLCFHAFHIRQPLVRTCMFFFNSKGGEVITLGLSLVEPLAAVTEHVARAMGPLRMGTDTVLPGMQRVDV